MENTVKFISTTQAKYDALVSKDAGSLYFTSDTHRIYKGSELFSISDVSNLATKADATLTERGFSEWTISPNIDNPVSAECLAAFQVMYPSVTNGTLTIDDGWHICIGGQQATSSQDLSTDGTTLTFNGYGWAELGEFLGVSIGDVIATRTALSGYILGPDDPSNPNRDKFLASEAEVIALRDRVAALEAAIGQGLNGNY